MSEKLITKDEVGERTAINLHTLRRMVRQGQFPAPVKISPQRIAFVESEVDGWIADRNSEAGKTATTLTFCEEEF